MPASYRAMIATAFDYAQGDAASRVAAWRQIVDIVAQAGERLDGGTRDQAFATLARLARDVPVEQRRLASASLAGRIADPVLASVFTHDVPAVAAPMLARLGAADVDWNMVIPALPAASRNILRNRRDLPDIAVRSLGRYAAADLALPASTNAREARADSPAGGTTPILDLVERIAQFRQREPVRRDTPDHALPAVDAHGFMFETDGEGTITWVEGVARLAIIGVSLAQAAAPGEAGVDAAAAGAWRRRAPLGPCRLMIAGNGSAAGDWTIEASPLFDPRSGRFVGYRGEARRPRPGERADVGAATKSFDPQGSDSVRQLIHELRTPLNAIQGFAAMIEGQLLGPASAAHRGNARGIMTEAERLVGLIDDLDLAARLDAGLVTMAPASLGTAIARVIDEQRPALAERGVAVRLVMNEHAEEGVSGGTPDMVERTVARLLAAILATAEAGETVEVSMRPSGDEDILRIERPVALRGLETTRLLDAEPDLDGAWPDASLLGLGFTLRLCMRLANEQGGRLVSLPDAIELALPTIDARHDYIAR